VKLSLRNLFFLNLFVFSKLIFAMLGPPQDSDYRHYPITFHVNEVPLVLLQKEDDLHLRFYPAIQHEKLKNNFFIIPPCLLYNREVQSLVYQALQNKRLFPALVLYDNSFLVTNFKVIRIIEAGLSRLQEILFQHAS
jgi:hypothetical protein